jgi:hypothetical protein
LKHDASAGVTGKGAAKYARGQTWLGRCELIALGSKHAVLHDGRSPTVHGGKTQKSELLWGVVSRHSVRIQEGSYFEIEIDGARYDAIPAIEGCLKEWEDFLRGRGLM